MKRPGIVVVGSSNTDLTVRARRLPGPGQTVLGGDLRRAPGGKGANQAVAAHRAGADTWLVACVGDDDFGRQALRDLRNAGVRTPCVRVDEKSPSGVALILLDAGGENLISVAPGANWRVRRLDVRAAAPVFARCSVAVLQLEVPPAAVAEGIRQARRAGCLVILNPAPAPARPLPASLLRTVDILTPNRSEASALTGIRVDSVRSAERAARHLLRQGAGTVIVTLGPQGALAVTPDDSFHAPPLPVRVVDTVGAGDAFNGALACALAEKRDLKDAVSFASAAAGLAVTRPGAQPSMPHRKEILDALRTFR